MTTTETSGAFAQIMESTLFRIGGHDIDLCAALVRLVEAIEDEPEDSDDWLYLGEGDECCAPDLLVAGYWSLSEWHGGQWSEEYAAQCAIGRIFSPGMTSGPEPDSGEESAYQAFDRHFAAKHRAAPY